MYHLSARNVLMDGNTVKASLRRSDGSWLSDHIHLNSVVGNHEGKFATGVNFTHTAQDISYKVLSNGDIQIRADLLKSSGEWVPCRTTLLSKHLSNSEGRFRPEQPTPEHSTPERPVLKSPQDWQAGLRSAQREGRAKVYGWNRVIDKYDVRGLVKKLRQGQPRQYIAIVSGIHGSPNQELEISHLKNTAANQLLISSFLPVNDFAEYNFFKEDTCAFGEDDHIIIYDGRKRPNASEFKQKLLEENWICVFAFCFSSLHPYYKLTADAGYEYGWRVEKGHAVSAPMSLARKGH